MNEIEYYFSENASVIYGREFQKKESSWFNGRSYYPSYKYRIATEKLQMVYDYLSNELLDSNTLLPSKSDYHIIKIRYKFSSDLNAGFEMMAKWFLWKLFHKKKYHVRSSNKELADYLSGNDSIRKLYAAYFDPEFSPKVKGISKEGRYVITFRFSLIRFNPEIFNLISDFLLHFESKYANPGKENQSVIS